MQLGGVLRQAELSRTKIPLWILVQDFECNRAGIWHSISAVLDFPWGFSVISTEFRGHKVTIRLDQEALNSIQNIADAIRKYKNRWLCLAKCEVNVKQAASIKNQTEDAAWPLETSGTASSEFDVDFSEMMVSLDERSREKIYDDQEQNFDVLYICQQSDYNSEKGSSDYKRKMPLPT